jgi:ElaB/YqjD/DUF883 family membrane-anchored ribosome-binding protein
MGIQPSVHNQLTAHRLAAKESRDRMRSMIADIQKIIRHTKDIVADSRDAIDRADALLRTNPTGDQSPR